MEPTGLEFGGTDRFQIVRPLGAGGMGAVYQAFDRERRVEVALKTLLALTPDALLRFKEEFRALARSEPSSPESHRHRRAVRGGARLVLHDGADRRRRLSQARSSRRGSSTRNIDGGEDRRSPDDGGSGQRHARAIPGLGRGTLRACLPQLVGGLEALHAAGKVHRDIKPSNVLVTREGRVVVLDFGLVTDADRRELSRRFIIVGTVGYMAPEQAAGEPSARLPTGTRSASCCTKRSPASLPFVGPPLNVMTAKQQLAPQPPRSISHIPKDLDALCCQLLRFDPTRAARCAPHLRSAGHQGRGRSRHQLAVGGNAVVALRRPRSAARRARERAQRRQARQAARRLCHRRIGRRADGAGPPLHRRPRAHRSRHADSREGRCYERESVPFKAVDSLIDNMTRHLMKVRANEILDSLPSNLALLSQVFPVLRRVEAVAERDTIASRSSAIREISAIDSSEPYASSSNGRRRSTRSSSSSTIYSGPTKTRWRCWPRSCASPRRRRCC